MSRVITVSKRGDIYRVGVDATTGQPMRLASHDDQQGFMQTYTSLQELQQNWPGCEFQFLEKKTPLPHERTVEPLTPEQQARVMSVAAEHLGKENVAVKPTAVTPIRSSVALPTKQAPASNMLDAAQQFLKRLETAREYASKKNQKELDVKIATVKELIDEVFKA